METSWLCPQPGDRERFLEMEERLAHARMTLYGALGAGAVITGPWLGWWTVVPVVLSVLTYQALKPRMRTSRRPEYLAAGQIAFAQLLIAIVTALTGGPDSPIMVLSFLPLVTLPARFGTRGVRAGVALTIVFLTAATAAVDPTGFLNDPSLFVLTLVGLIGLTAFSDLLQKTEMSQRTQAVIDPLTGLLNRRALDNRFAELQAQAVLSAQPVSLIVCDVDNFKRVNDAFGHARGDEVLEEVADLLRTHTRSYELIYRLGGDEFLIVLPGRAAPDALDLAERLRESAAETLGGVTLSFGVSGATGEGIQFEPLFDAADRALYAAKASGRDTVAGSTGAESLPEPV